MQNQIALGVFNTLGANAVPMPFSELFTALETRTVDGQENPITTIQSSKFYEVQPYLTITRHVTRPGWCWPRRNGGTSCRPTSNS